MAEILGLVASGLSIAQIAGSIVKTSVKVKALLDEVKDAPETLRDMLEYIDLLTPILCEATVGGANGASTIPPVSPASSHLQHALTACQKAGEQLEILAGDLMSQIDAARGRVKRKRAIVKVVLKKGTLAQHEKRLERAIRLLQVAQGTYTIALQRTQPDTIVSQLVSALAQSHQCARGPDQSPPQFHSPSTATARRRSAHRNARSLQEYWQLGFAKVTGLVRIHASSSNRDDQTTASAPNRVLRVQVQMPAWLCATVLDAVFSRSYGGWNCSLNTYGYLVRGSVESGLVTDAIVDDDVDAIYRLFQERRCGPLDLLVGGVPGRESSLLDYALWARACRVSGYLVNCGVAQPLAITVGFGRSSRYSGIENETFFEELLKYDELNDTLRMQCLASSKNLDSFTYQVGRLWPYGEFYTEALEHQRLVLAATLVNLSEGPWVPPSAIFQHLCESASLVGAGSSTTTKVLSCIAWGIGHTVWRGPDVEAEWYSAILDTVHRLDQFLVMPEQQLTGCGLVRFGNIRLSAYTPFTDMFLGSMFQLPGRNGDSKRFRHHKIGSRLARCAKALQMWLKILQECGIDLSEYGRQEIRRLKDQEDGGVFNIYRDVWGENPYMQTLNGKFELRLIGFEYGNQPEDWKLWWSEPTDSLVGDFWKEVEPEPLCMPGSWDEDF